jgi:glutamine amidotransferase
MEHLRAQGLDRLIKGLRQPVLGICLGMQLMCRHSEEGDVDCLHIFDSDVRQFVPQKHEDKVPHVGWNMLSSTRSPLFGEALHKDNFYAVQFHPEKSGAAGEAILRNFLGLATKP